MATRCRYSATGDNHLLKLHPYREISIFTPKQFLEAKPWQS
jgi:predicted nucleic acid-binding protein